MGHVPNRVTWKVLATFQGLCKRTLSCFQSNNGTALSKPLPIYAWNASSHCFATQLLGWLALLRMASHRAEGVNWADGGQGMDRLGPGGGKMGNGCPVLYFIGVMVRKRVKTTYSRHMA